MESFCGAKLKFLCMPLILRALTLRLLRQAPPLIYFSRIFNRTKHKPKELHDRLNDLVNDPMASPSKQVDKS